MTAFFYGFRDREKVLDILEQTTGGRLIQTYNTIGGVQADIHPDFVRRVKEFIAYMRPTLREYQEVFTGNVIALSLIHISATEPEPAQKSLEALTVLHENSSNYEAGYWYFLARAVVCPEESVKAYEEELTDDYWQRFWGFLSYCNTRCV